MDLSAIILAAGKGSRLVEATFGSPKPLVDINGISLIQRQINLYKKERIRKITVIRGYKLNEFQLKNVNYVDDLEFDNHDQLGSLISGINEIEGDVLITFGDILFDELPGRSDTILLAVYSKKFVPNNEAVDSV